MQDLNLDEYYIRTILFVIFNRSQYVVKSRSPRSSPATNYFRDWNRYLSPRSDGYNDVDEPKIDIGVILNMLKC